MLEIWGSGGTSRTKVGGRRESSMGENHVFHLFGKLGLVDSYFVYMGLSAHKPKFIQPRILYYPTENNSLTTHNQWSSQLSPLHGSASTPHFSFSPTTSSPKTMFIGMRPRSPTFSQLTSPVSLAYYHHTFLFLDHLIILIFFKKKISVSCFGITGIENFSLVCHGRCEERRNKSGSRGLKVPHNSN